VETREQPDFATPLQQPPLTAIIDIGSTPTEKSEKRGIICVFTLL
jgi:hypothetical protein